jgi:hypothetical protein
MGSTAIRSSALLLGLLAAGSAFGHPNGFHKKLTVTLTKTKVSALLVMDVDSGERCLLLREAVDSNRDGQLTGAELTQLKERLVKMATKPLKLSISGAPIELVVKGTKLSLRDDRRANDAALSVAVLVEIEHQHPVSTGMDFEVEDIAPDQSTIVLQVFQEGSKEAPFQAEVKSGVKTKVRFN